MNSYAGYIWHTFIKPVGVIFMIAFLYHHLTRTVDKINVVSLRTCLSFLKVRGIFLSDPLSLRDLDEQFWTSRSHSELCFTSSMLKGATAELQLLLSVHSFSSDDH